MHTSQEREARVVGSSEGVEPVGTAINETPGCAQIAGSESLADFLFVRFEEAGEQTGRNVGMVGKIGIFDELVAQPDRCAVQRVIGRPVSWTKPRPLKRSPSGGPWLPRSARESYRSNGWPPGEVLNRLSNSLMGRKDPVSARMVASAIRIIGSSASSGAINA